MEILSLTIVLTSLIMIGAIVGIYLQSKISDMHSHIEASHNETRLQIVVLNTKISELERGINDTRNDVKAISDREETTDPNIRWGK